MLNCGCSNKWRITGKAKYVHFTLSRALVAVCTTGGRKKNNFDDFKFFCVLSVWLYSVLRSFK